MRDSVLTLPGAALIAGNAILSFVCGRILTADPIPQGTTLPASTIPAVNEAKPLMLKKVTRRSDPAAERLFGLPPAEVATPARLVEAAQSETLAPRLVGVIMGEGADGERIALIEDGMPAHIARLRKGAHLDPSGWRIEQISSSSVEVIRGDERRTLRLN